MKQNTHLSFNVKNFLKLCVKSWKTFIVTWAVLLFITGVYILHSVPEVEVDAQVMLAQDSGAGAGMMSDITRAFAFGDFLGGSSSTDNEVDVMRSHSVLAATARELGLDVTVYERENPLRWVPMFTKAPLALVMNPSIPDTIQTSILFTLKRTEGNKVDIKVKIRKKTVADLKGETLPAAIKTPYGEFTIAPTDYYATSQAEKMRIKLTSYNSAAEAYAKKVKIFPPNKKTDFITLTYTTPDRLFGEKLLNTIIEKYLNVGNSQKVDKNNRTLEFVNNRLTTLTSELAASESEIQSFKQQNKIIDPELDITALHEKNGALDQKLLETQTESEILGMTLKFISDPANNYSLIPPLSDSQSNEITTYNNLILERMKILNSAKGNNSALASINSQIDAMRETIITSVKRAYENSNLRLKDIARESDNTSARMGSIPMLEREFRNMMRVQTIQEQLFLFLLKQREEVAMSLASIKPAVEIIDKPHTITEDIGLSSKKLLALVLFLSTLVVMFVLYWFRYNSTAITTHADIESMVSTPVAGFIATSASGGNIMADGSDNPAAEAIRALRQNLLYILSETGGNTVLVTSPRRNEGKTFVASNLAVAFAMLGKKTLLLDTDMRHPGVADTLGIASADTLADSLANGTTPTPTTLVVAKGRTLDVIPAGDSTIPSELLAGDEFSSLISKYKAEYDFVIIDSAPVASYSDTFGIAAAADVTLMVTRMNVTTGTDVDFIGNLFEDGRLPRIAIVENCVSPGKHYMTATTFILPDSTTSKA